MKRSKVKLLMVWLLAAAFIFSNLNLEPGVFANENHAGDNAAGVKNISDRLVFGEAIDVHILETPENKIPVYIEGIHRDNHPPVKYGSKLIIKYVWEVPEDNFNGEGEFSGKGQIAPNDTFRIELPNFKHIRFLGFKHDRQINSDPQKNYGTWNIKSETVNGNTVQYIVGTLGDGIGAENVGGLEKGYFEIIAEAREAGDLNLNINPNGPEKMLKITANQEFKIWTPGPFYKQGSPNSSDHSVSWSMITGFDNLKYAFEKGQFQNTDGNSTSVHTGRKNMIIYDKFPADTDIQEIQLKIPVYIPSPQPQYNSYNYDSEGNMYPETHPQYVKAGQLTWQSLHQMEVIFKVKEEKNGIITNNPGEDLDEFKARVNHQAQNDDTGMPSVGLFTDESQKLVYVNLGDTPNKAMTYDDFFKKSSVSRRTGYNELSEYIESMKTLERVDENQFAIMKEAYLGGPHQGKILAWSVGIKVNVPDEDHEYSNDATFEWSGENSGPGKPLKAKQTVKYAKVSSGVEIFKRLSFPVTKKWLDKSGAETEAPQSSVRVDVYRIDGDKKTKINRASILLSKQNQWKGKVTGLPIYDRDNQLIEYTLEEEKVAGYTASIERISPASIEKGFIITNRENRIENPISVTVRKEWAHGSKEKPISIILQKRSGENEKWTDEGNVELSGNTWVHTFPNLDRNFEYRVIEEQLPGYESESSRTTDTQGNIHYLFKNTQKSGEFVDIEVEKTWVGEGLESVIIELYSTADLNDESKYQKVDEVILISPNWKHTFLNFPKTEEGETIYYAVKEIPIDGYDVDVSLGNTSKPNTVKFIITNTFNPFPKKDISVKKVWSENNTDVGEITAELISDDGTEKKLVSAVKLNDENNWSHIFENIQTNTATGKNLIFSVREIAVPGYITKISGDADNGFVITNTKETAVTTNASTEAKDDTDTTATSSESSDNHERDENEDEDEDDTHPSAEKTTPSSVSTTEKKSPIPPSVEKPTDKSYPETSPHARETTFFEDMTVTTGEIAFETTESASLTENFTAPTIVVAIPTNSLPTTAIPATTRTFEYIDIAEDIPLGVKTTAPIDLELVLIEESVPLSGLPYTASVPFELFIGFGMLILTVGLTLGRRL